MRGSTLQEEVDRSGADNPKPLRAIIIGKDDWVDENTGTYVKNAEPAAALTRRSSTPSIRASPRRDSTRSRSCKRVPPMGVETKNGVQAVHYHADQSTALNPPNPTVPPGAVFDVWVSTDNDFLVAFEYSGLKSKDGSETAGQIELMNVNDPSLSVKAPS